MTPPPDAFPETAAAGSGNEAPAGTGLATAARMNFGPVRLGPPAAGRCRRRVHLDADPTADRSHLKPPDPGLELRLADLAAHREEVAERLANASELTTAWSPADPGRPGAIWAARLSTASRYGSPDLLLWAGDGYLPVIVRGHRTLDPGSGARCSSLDDPLAVAVDPRRRMRRHPDDLLALAHHYRLLGELGLASATAEGGVIGRGGPVVGGDLARSQSQSQSQAQDWDDGSVIVWHTLAETVLADYDARFADRLAVAQAAATGRPALAAPSRVAECRRCRWWPVCSVELIAARDISLLVAGGDVKVMHAAGVRSYDDLLAMDAAAVSALPLTGIPAGEARARALAVRATVPMLRRTERISAPAGEVELDVDMESYQEDGAYLWGTYLSGVAVPGFAPGYRPFVTWQPLCDPATAGSAGEVFAEFWAYLSALRSAAATQGLTFAAYCYSRAAEERWLRAVPQRFPDVSGMPQPAEVAAFYRSPQWVDLYAEVKRCFVVPGSMRLKAVATVSGFSWRDPEPSGENSLAWYRQAVDSAKDTGQRGTLGTAFRSDGGTAPRSDDDAAPRCGGDAAPRSGGEDDLAGQSRQRILRYNEDDVLATLSLRRWMRERADEVPTVAELEAAGQESPQEATD